MSIFHRSTPADMNAELNGIMSVYQKALTALIKFKETWLKKRDATEDRIKELQADVVGFDEGLAGAEKKIQMFQKLLGETPFEEEAEKVPPTVEYHN